MADVIMPKEMVLNYIRSLKDGDDAICDIVYVAIEKYWAPMGEAADMRRALAHLPFNPRMSETDFLNIYALYSILDRVKDAGSSGGISVKSDGDKIHTVRYEITHLPERGSRAKGKVLDMLKRSRDREDDLLVGEVAECYQTGKELGIVRESTDAGVVIEEKETGNWIFKFHSVVKRKEGKND